MSVRLARRMKAQSASALAFDLQAALGCVFAGSERRGLPLPPRWGKLLISCCPGMVVMTKRRAVTRRLAFQWLHLHRFHLLVGELRVALAPFGGAGGTAGSGHGCRC